MATQRVRSDGDRASTCVDNYNDEHCSGAEQELEIRKVAHVAPRAPSRQHEDQTQGDRRAGWEKCEACLEWDPHYLRRRLVENNDEIRGYLADLATARAEVERLRAEAACACGQPAEFSDRWCGQECSARHNSPLAQLRADNDRLREGLRRYGQHDGQPGAMMRPVCWVGPSEGPTQECTCGLDTLLAETGTKGDSDE